MPTSGFVEVRKWIKDTATAHNIDITGRRIKSLAAHWILEEQLWEDGEAMRALHYADPTGEQAVKHLLALMRGATK